MYWIGLITGIVLSVAILQLKTGVLTDLLMWLKYEYEQRKKDKTSRKTGAKAV